MQQSLKWSSCSVICLVLFLLSKGKILLLLFVNLNKHKKKIKKQRKKKEIRFFLQACQYRPLLFHTLFSNGWMDGKGKQQWRPSVSDLSFQESTFSSAK